MKRTNKGGTDAPQNLKQAIEQIKSLEKKAANHLRAGKKANETVQLLCRELELKNKELGELNVLKSEFISTVSHELRTPITIFREGISQLLDGIHGEVNESQHMILTMSLKNVDRLASLINDLLDISKLDAGKVILDRRQINFAEAAGSVVQSFQRAQSDQKVKISLNCDQKEIFCYADIDRLRQVFTNLLSNAVKFTENGTVTVSVKDLTDKVECAVSDTGKGITGEDLPKVFGRFEQFGRTHGPGEKGTGLGLAICKKIVTLHQGKIDVESEFGKGTRFIFSIPKLSPRQVFLGNLKNQIDYCAEQKVLCVVAFLSLTNEAAITEAAGKEAVRRLIVTINEAVHINLRRKADRCIADKDRVWLLLSETNDENAKRVTGRLDQAVKLILDQQNLSIQPEWFWRYAAYPENGETAQELLESIDR